MKAATLALFLAFMMGVALCDSNKASRDNTEFSQEPARANPAAGGENNGESSKIDEIINKLLNFMEKQIQKALKEFMKQIVGRSLPKFQNKLRSDVGDLRARVQEIKNSIVGRLNDTGTTAVDCISAHSYEVDAVLNSTVAKTLNCADVRVNEIRRLLADLNDLALDINDASNDALYKAGRCVQNGGGVLITGACLRSVALQTERKAVYYMTQSGISLSSASLAVATLSSALDVCSGTYLVEAGLATAGIAADIGRCSVSNSLSVLFSNREW